MSSNRSKKCGKTTEKVLKKKNISWECLHVELYNDFKSAEVWWQRSFTVTDNILVSGRRRLKQNWEFFCRSQRMPLTSSSPTLRRLRRNQRSSRSESLPCVRRMDVCGGGGMFCQTLTFKVERRAGPGREDQSIIARLQTAGKALLGNGFNWPQCIIYRLRV